MSTPTHDPILQALVRRVRLNAALYARLVGGIHEGFAPGKAKYPFAVYNLVAAPYEWDWSSVTLTAIFDLFVFSRDPVEAGNLDAELAAWIGDQPFPVEGQITLLCRRVATVPMPPDVDVEQMKVYQRGGTYQIETDVSTSPRIFHVGATDVTTVSDGA